MEQNSKWIVVAAQLVQWLHKSQKDKAGVDYFSGHLLLPMPKSTSPSSMLTCPMASCL